MHATRLFSAHLHNAREATPAKKIQSCFYVVYWRNHVHVTEVPLTDAGGRPSIFAKLGKRAVDAMQNFHKRVLAPCIFVKRAMGSVVPLIKLDWEGVDAALASLKTSRDDARAIVEPDTVKALRAEVKAADDYAVIPEAGGMEYFLQHIGAMRQVDSVREWFTRAKHSVAANQPVAIKTASSIDGGSADLRSIVYDLQCAVVLSAYTDHVASKRGVRFSTLSCRAFGNVALSGALTMQKAFARTQRGNEEWSQLEATSALHQTSPLVILAAQGMGRGAAACLLAGQQELWAELLRCRGDAAAERRVLMTRYDVEAAFEKAEDAEGVRGFRSLLRSRHLFCAPHPNLT